MEELCLYVKEALLAHNNCSLRGRLIIKHTSMADCKPFMRPGRVNNIFGLSFYHASEHSISWRGALIQVLWLLSKGYPLVI